MNTKVAPLDVPTSMSQTYLENFEKATHGTGRLMLFAGDQKIEHLNEDFYGEGIAEEDADPVHLFNIASQAKIGVFATQIGLIAHYGMDYRDIPYIVKLNSKSPLVPTSQRDPISTSFTPVSKVAEFQKNSGLKIMGVGYTVYIGSEFENVMLREAAAAIYEAHQHGMMAIIWAYPRGKAVTNEKDPRIVAGAAGIMGCLGADFVKINAPKEEGQDPYELLKQATSAAGRTKVVCAGGSSSDPQKFLEGLYKQIHTGGTAGNATGRNIHQRPLKEAVAFANAIYGVSIEDKTAEEAFAEYMK